MKQKKKIKDNFNSLLSNKTTNTVFLNKLKYDELISKVNKVKIKQSKKFK